MKTLNQFLNLTKATKNSGICMPALLQQLNDSKQSRGAFFSNGL